MVLEKFFEKGGVKSSVIFSDDEKHRYVLRRAWDSGPENGGKNRKIVFIGLNPSTADEKKNDPTILRMINFSKLWGFSRLSVCNLFAFRATIPADMKNSEDPVGLENDFYLMKEISDADKVIACWGNHGKFLSRGKEISKTLGNFEHFGFTKQGEPRHVLYLKRDAPLEAFG